MAHNSTENLIRSDSSTSTDELNNGSHSRSVEKVSKKMFHKKKTAFVGANSVTSPSSSVTSSPQQHPIIVVGTADVHQPNTSPRLSPPKPFPRKHLMTTAKPMVTKRKDFLEVDDIVDTTFAELNSLNKDKGNITNRENFELCEIRTQSESSGGQSDKTEDPKMFFARSRKNTIVTNADEVSINSSSRTNKSSQNKSKSDEEPKPLPKPRLVEPQYEIIQEKPLKKRVEALVKLPNNITSCSDQSKSSYSASETFTDEAIRNYEESGRTKTKVETDEVHVHPTSIRKGDQQDKIIGVYIHSSSELKYNYNVHRPMVRCSIVDGTNGQLLQSRKTNGIIQPVMTKGCRFTSSKFQCQWEQLLTIDENISHIMHENSIIFFELLDTPSIESKNVFEKWSKITDEWHYICWGFLKIGDGVNCSNIDKRSCLQLFRYQRGHLFRKFSMNVYDQFRMDRVKYPATFLVTVKGITTVKSPLAKNDQMKVEWNILTDKTQSESNEVLKFANIEDSSINQANFLRRLPGQICKYPNMIHKTHLEPSSKGCLVSKFSPNGQFLAYSSNSDYNIQIATIPDLKVINTLRGHTNFVYDLDWMVDKRKNSFPLHLVSASSDRTAVVWTIEKDKISLTILPHPSFLYAAKFLVNLTDDECCLFTVTGGRDCAVRVWKVADNNFHLLQESVEHQNYITSVACSSIARIFFSSDWNGCIFEWSTQEHIKYFQVTRKFPQLTEGILTLHLHPKNELRLYAQLKNHQINCLDISSTLVLNTLDIINGNQGITNKFTISPCGSTIYTSQWDTILIHNILSGTLQNSFKIPYVKHRKSYISHLDYHPKLFLLSASVYGVNGGVVLMGHKSDAYSTDNHKGIVHQSSADDRWMLLKDNVNPQSSELLGNIIQRIDDILHQPNQHKNETDDFKKKNIEDMIRSDREVHYDKDIANVGTSVELGSLEISSESDSDSSIGSCGTFTIERKQSVSEISNRTFTLQKSHSGFKGKPQVDDGTYSIEVDDNSDDTTISESM